MTGFIGAYMKLFIRVLKIAIFYSIVLSSNVEAQTLERHQAITAYIYNFANNIQWQNEAAISEFKILLIGEDQDVFNEMETLSNSKTLRGIPITIVSSPSVDNIDGVQLIYITKDQEHSITELFDKIEGKNILLVSDGFQDKRLIMINFIESEEETLSFEINKANIINQNLSFTDDLVLFGGTEIDVAALYREGQQSLRSLQKHTDSLENDLVVLEHTITSKTQEIQVQKDNLDGQNLKILAQHDSLNKQTLKIQYQQKTLSNRSQLLEEKKTDIRTQNREIQVQQNILDDQYRESEIQKENLNKGNALLQDQKNEILSQTKILEEKTGTIVKQRNMLFLLVIITLLVIVLVLLIYSRYKSKQKLNKLLESKVEKRTIELHNSNEKLLAELTDRKQAEEKLLESEERFRGLMKQSPFSIQILDTNGVTTLINSAFENLWGLKFEDLKDYNMLQDEQLVKLKIMPFIEKAFAGEAVIIPTSEYDVQDTFGKGLKKWVQAHVYPITDNTGKIVNVILVHEDITERKQAEEALQLSEERFRNFFASSPGLIAIYQLKEDNRLEIIQANPMIVQILGRDLDTIIGKTFEEAFPSKADTDIPARFLSVALGGQTQTFLDHYTDENLSIWTEVNVFPMGENMIGVVSIDITDRKQAEEELVESEGKLNALFTSLTEMVVMHELVLNTAGEAIDYRIIDCNKVFTEVTGIRQEDAIGKLASEVYQADPPPYLEKFAKVGLGGDPYEFTTFYPPLDKHFLISVVSPQVGKFTTITTDVSDMMQIQEMIMAKNKEMENYLYITSHDLRTPLVNIQGFSQRLKKQADSIKTLFADKTLDPEILHQLGIITDEDIPKTLSYVFSNINKMDILINGLLQLSRAGKVHMNIQKIDMNAMFTTMLQGLDFQIKETQCEIHIDPLPECYGDAALIDQLFSNIISNALKYSDSERALKITVGAKKTYNRVVYTIRDTGKGMAQKHLEKIWDIFYRIDPRSGKTGEGIGLSLVKQIVEKHRGKVWAESKENKGSVFYIELNNHSFTEL